MEITKKYAAWEPGQATKTRTLSEEAITRLATELADGVNESLVGMGISPVTVTVRLDVSIMSLVGGEKEGAKA